MTGKTHILAGLNAAVLCIGATHPKYTLLTAGCAVLGSVFPDIDIATSKLGKKIRPVSAVIQMLVGHRTLFHAPLFYLLLWCVLTHCFPAYEIYFTAAAVGVATHILLDCLNPAGIPLLYPWRKRFRFAKLRTGGKSEWIIIGMMLATLIGQSLYFLEGMLA